MTRTIDARGLSCPQPVILTKKVMDEKSGGEIVTIVDNPAALENVSKLAASQGYTVRVETKGQESYIHMDLQAWEAGESAEVAAQEPEAREMVILVKSQFFGQGDDELGAVLTRSFLYTLSEMTSRLHSVIFMNGGIHLTTEGSPVLENLKFLEENGVQILSCGTCLDFFHKKEQLQVGQVTNMYTALEILSQAVKPLII